jgi:hypothetical protein
MPSIRGLKSVIALKSLPVIGSLFASVLLVPTQARAAASAWLYANFSGPTCDGGNGIPISGFVSYIMVSGPNGTCPNAEFTITTSTTGSSTWSFTVSLSGRTTAVTPVNIDLFDLSTGSVLGPVDTFWFNQTGTHEQITYTFIAALNGQTHVVAPTVGVSTGSMYFDINDRIWVTGTQLSP